MQTSEMEQNRASNFIKWNRGLTKNVLYKLHKGIYFYNVRCVHLITTEHDISSILLWFTSSDNVLQCLFCLSLSGDLVPFLLKTSDVWWCIISPGCSRGHTNATWTSLNPSTQSRAPGRPCLTQSMRCTLCKSYTTEQEGLPLVFPCEYLLVFPKLFCGAWQLSWR